MNRKYYNHILKKDVEMTDEEMLIDDLWIKHSDFIFGVHTLRKSAFFQAIKDYNEAKGNSRK